MNSELYRTLLRIARSRVGDERAPDVVHDAICAVLQRYGAEALSNHQLMSRIVARRAIDVARYEARRQHVALEPWHGGQGDVEEAALLRLEAEQAANLAWASCAAGWPAPVSVLIACGWTANELGRMRRMPVSTVKTALLRERQRVRRLLAS